MPENNSNPAVKYSAVKSITKPVWLVSDNLGFFAALGIFCSFLLLILSYLFGQTYLCVFNSAAARGLPCNAESYWYFLYLPLKLILISLFIAVWNGKVFGRREIDGSYLLKELWKSWLIAFLVFAGFMVLNLLPAVSGALLIYRVPNPEWKIELAYFTVVAIGFVVPFILMRLYAVVGEVLCGEGFKNVLAAWRNTGGQGLKIVLSAGAMFMINIILLIGVNGAFREPQGMVPGLHNVAAEIVFNLITLLMAALVVNYIQVQREIVLDSPKR